MVINLQSVVILKNEIKKEKTMPGRSGGACTVTAQPHLPSGPTSLDGMGKGHRGTRPPAHVTPWKCQHRSFLNPALFLRVKHLPAVGLLRPEGSSGHRCLLLSFRARPVRPVPRSRVGRRKTGLVPSMRSPVPCSSPPPFNSL